jgi:hypothetical protein
MNDKLLDALETCLQRIQQGEPLDSVLTHYPHLAAQLRPLLKTAMRARSTSRESLPPTVLSRQRSRGLALAADLRMGKNHHLLQRRFWRLAITVLSVIAILVMSSNGLLIASAHSIPGDTLYPLKRSVESTQLHLVSDPAEKQVLEQEFSERRVDETKSLITHQRVESVEFTGVVSSQSESEWVVSGIPVVITTQTNINEGIGIGDEIEVDGSTTAAGGVEAIRLSLVKDSAKDLDHPAVLPTQTPSPQESGESGVMETSTESSVTPAYSSEDETQASDSKDQPSTKSDENHSSSETTHTPQPDSKGEGD